MEPPTGAAASHWISLLEHELLDSDPHHAESLLWCHTQQQLPHHPHPQQQQLKQLPHQPSLSLENDSSKGDSHLNQDKSCPKKRTRDECTSASVPKACREKMRRDRLNDRFMELSAVLEPDKPPKTDKASILRDAARILSQLRAEMHQLRDANDQLQETIKELKAEKNELRDEKMTLKTEKERLENHFKTANVVSGYVPTPGHSQGVHGVSLAAYAASGRGAHVPKNTSFPDVTFPMTMAQWMTPVTVDISNDHVLRPPVA